VGFIQNKNKNPIKYSDLFVERLLPSATFGKPKDDPKSVEIMGMIDRNFYDPDYHYADEENFTDLKLRAQNALHYLSELKEDNILVVTHSYFMRVLVAYVTFGDGLTARECKRFIKTFYMENTGLSILGYDIMARSPWRLLVWNDHAHLG
jgi:broad specificity phosphatase PhoE